MTIILGPPAEGPPPLPWGPGPPAEGPGRWGSPAPPWATAAAVGPRGGGSEEGANVMLNKVF